MDCSEESPLFLKTISKKLDFRKTGREVSALKNTPRSYPRGEKEGGWVDGFLSRELLDEPV